MEILQNDGTLFDAELSMNKIEVGGEIYFLSIARDVTKRKQIENALDERIEFEKMISGLSATFINLPTTEVDKYIDEGLLYAGKFFTWTLFYLPI